MSQELEHMSELIGQVAEKSDRGDINWTQPNPSTFQWLRQDGGGDALVVSIQRAIASSATAMKIMGLSPRDAAEYLFQIQEAGAKRVVVSLSSKERPQLKGALEALYSSAERGLDQRTNRFIERLLLP